LKINQKYWSTTQRNKHYGGILQLEKLRRLCSESH